MANPFLVLGGVAVGVITAAIGVLSVPGWIDNANDSAAINDLGSIRNAESAAVLQLGEYTADLAVLESAELGVKLQRSDGVRLTGLHADSNESWCGATQSKSGKFFAASHLQAAIATGPGALSAMTTAGCVQSAIDDILASSTGDLGDPGATGGSFVGGSRGSEGGGEQGFQTGGAYPLGGTQALTINAHGFYALANQAGTYVKRGSDGVTRQLNIPASVWDDTMGPGRAFASDAEGNLYVDASTMQGTVFMRIAPDGTTTRLNEPSYENNGTFYNTPAGDVYILNGQSLYRVAGDELQLVLDASQVSGDWLRLVGVDAEGNIHLASQESWYKVAHDGTSTSQPLRGADGEFQWGYLQKRLYVAPNGTRYATEGENLLHYDEQGAPTILATPRSALGTGALEPEIGTMDTSGNIYLMSAHRVIQVTPDGSVLEYISDQR